MYKLSFHNTTQQSGYFHQVEYFHEMEYCTSWKYNTSWKCSVHFFISFERIGIF